MKIALFFGSFNPIHIGHMIIANHILEYTDNIKNIWFIVSAQNPFKKKSILDNFKDRLNMVNLSIKGYKNMKVLDIEFFKPKPSYTIDTVNDLQKRYPKKKFILIIGEDLLKDLPNWKNINSLINSYKIYIYPRFPFFFSKKNDNRFLYIKNGPLLNISSSFIRLSIKNNKKIKPLLSLPVFKYIIKNNLYKF